MKQNNEDTEVFCEATVPESLSGIVDGLSQCVLQFTTGHQSHVDAAMAAAFANGACLMATKPSVAVGFLNILKSMGTAPDHKTLFAALNNFEFVGNWMVESVTHLDSLPDNPKNGPREVDSGIMFAAAAGIMLTAKKPKLCAQCQQAIEALNSEGQFLATRFAKWIQAGWRPSARPFIEYVALFYPPDSKEREVICRTVLDVLAIACTLSEAWSVSLWSETGWYAGRKIGLNSDVGRALIAETTTDTIIEYLTLYQDSIVATAGPTGEIRLREATLRYFADTKSDVFARSYCRGDQPRFVAWSAFDYAFWMGLLSTQQIPVRR